MPWYDIKASQYGTIIVIGYAYPFINQDVLRQWLPDLTYYYSFSYGMTPAGDLLPLDDAKVLPIVRAGGVEPLMVMTPLDATGQFSNDLAHQVLNNPAAVNNLINNITAEVQKKNYHGVDFDFEFVSREDRDKYTSLVARTAARLKPTGHIVTAALAPKVSSDQPGLLYGGHDYGGLGAAANLVMLMTYEWGYTYGPPMAVAPIDQVRRVLEYGLSQIPRAKILMGIPNYGYDWTLPYVQGESKAENISNPQAVARAARYGASIRFDQVAQSPYYNYTDAEGNQHVVWFEDARSMRAKLNLVHEYDIAGIGFWTIMDPWPEGIAVLHDMFTVAKVE